ncbi:MAG: class B sortase [Bacilli bacterium]|nr:class B sortase [Bacilli bacterium]
MNSNIVFKLSQNTISISEIKKEVDYKSLNNTNVINVKELKFSIEYIRENFELVSSFLNVIIIKKDIKTAIINNMDIALISIDLINSLEHIESVIFKPDKKVSYDLFLKLLDSRFLKSVECFDMSHFLIERLDVNKRLIVKTRNKISNPTPFSIINNLDSYSDIYYKKVLVIQKSFTKDELDELKAFISMNNRLKVIKLVKYSNEILTTIINELKDNNKRNILIQIYEKDNDLNTIFNSVNYIKKKEKNYLEKNNIRFKLDYSKEYKSKNFFKQINFKMFATLVGMSIILSLLIVGLNYYQMQLDREKINDTIDEIDDILESAITTTTKTTKNDIQENTTTTSKPLDPVYLANYEQVFDSLLKINKDTVAWIYVKNTKINYPVVQSTRNNYYLWRDFNKKRNNYGWIFMDYRNDPNDLDQNTIIYGHNVKEGIMFGTMRTMMNPSWYNKEDNRLITFNTIDKKMQWLMFSTYRISATEDYLRTNFNSEEEFMEFINLIKSRSKKDFKVDIKPTDKILTMQTCSSNNTRNVVHAVLVSVEEN